MKRMDNPTRTDLPRRDQRGFSLVELMVVVIVLAILAGTIIPQFAGTTYDARVSRARADIAKLEQQLELFNTKFDRYPSTEEGLEALVTGPKEAKNFQPLVKELVSDPWGKPYRYRSPGIHGSKTYDLWSQGADGADGGEDKGKDITNWKEETAGGAQA